MGTIEQWNNETGTNKQKAVTRAAAGLRPAAKNIFSALYHCRDTNLILEVDWHFQSHLLYAMNKLRANQPPDANYN